LTLASHDVIGHVTFDSL